MLRIWLLIWVSLVAVRAAAGAPGERPNIVVLLADDLGYGELGCYGGQEIPTPQLDRLARDGARFTQAYVTAPFCAASRAGLMTGRYQTRFGFELNPIGPRNDDPRIGLPPAELTMAEELRDAGYVTGLVGKWHLGGTAAYHPQRHGFDEFYGFLHEGHYFVPPPWNGVTTWLRRKTLPDGTQGRWTSSDGRTIWSTHMGHHEPDYDANNPILRNSQPVDERAHLTDALTREAEQFIERHRDQPFFLYVAYNAVHSPMQGEDSYLRQFAHIEDIHRRIFAAMLAHLDHSVGRILAKLTECGVAQDTLVVFLSDNGGPTRELTSSNRPLRGEKGQLYEGGIRVPLICRWPGVAAGEQTIVIPVSTLDLMPTFMSAAGVASPPASDGRSLTPWLRGAAPGEPRLHYWRVGPKAALRAGDWKIVRERRGSDWELYNLRDDVAESTNLAATNAEQLATLAAAWALLNAEMIAPLW